MFHSRLLYCGFKLSSRGHSLGFHRSIKKLVSGLHTLAENLMFVVDRWWQGIKAKALENVFPKRFVRAQLPLSEQPMYFSFSAALALWISFAHFCFDYLPPASVTLPSLFISWRCFHTHTEQQHTISLDSVFKVRKEPGSVSCEAFSLPKSFSLLCILWAIACSKPCMTLIKLNSVQMNRPSLHILTVHFIRGLLCVVMPLLRCGGSDFGTTVFWCCIKL